MSERGLKELEKQGMFGSDKIGNLEFCEDCVLGKSSRGSCWLIYIINYYQCQCTSIHNK